MKNKKSQVQIVILVFLALAVAGIALFTFITVESQRAEQISKIETINEIYAEEEIFIYMLKNLIAEMPIHFGDSSYILPLKTYLEYTQIDFEQQSTYPYGLFFKYANQIKSKLNEEKSYIKFENSKEGNKIIVHLEDFEFSSEKSGLKVSHIRDIDFEIDF